jgi:adenylate kinase family enzyme
MSAIAITGASGSGKSTSYLKNETLEIKGLDPRETLVINVSKKDLPGKSANKLFAIFDDVTGSNTKERRENIVAQLKNKKRQYRTDNPARIITLLDVIDTQYPTIKNVVIDDSQYIQGLMVMNRIQEQGWQKFNDVAEAGFGPIDKARNLKRKDLIVFFLYHPEVNEITGNTKIKTAGKAVDQYITIDGLFTVNLYTDVTMENKKPVYKFRTNTFGNDTCKSPAGMFDELYIPNDLGLVRDKFLEYYD